MYTHHGKEGPNWDDYTLILASVSVGNVGQLAADLLISTLWMDHVGSMYNDCFTPVIGNDPFYTGDPCATCELVTCCEVYESSSRKVVVVQIRAPLIKGKRKQFHSELFGWIHAHQFSKVVLLSSTHAHERLDQQMSGSQTRYLVTPKMSELYGSVFEDTLHWTQLEQRRALSGEEEVFMPGASMAKALFEECCHRNIAAAVLLTFCSEGDNAPDAVTLVTYLNQWLSLVELQPAQGDEGKVKVKPWRIPNSWRLNYGSSFDQTIFW